MPLAAMQRLEELRALSRAALKARDYAAYAALECVEVAIAGARQRLLEAQKTVKGDALQFVKELLEST